jgi:hypothetical protein
MPTTPQGRQHGFIERVVLAGEASTELVICRMRARSGGSFTNIVILVSSSLRGLVTMASIAFTFLEADLDFAWDDQRLASSRPSYARPCPILRPCRTSIADRDSAGCSWAFQSKGSYESV